MNTSETVFSKLQNNVLMPAVYTVGEIQRLFPDSLLFGSLFLYILTMNKSFGVFSLFIFETSLVHKFVSYLYEKTYGPRNSDSSRSSACYPGFRAPRKEVDRVLRTNPFPSLSIFSLWSVATYLLASTLAFSDTLSTMGKDWDGRIAFSISFVALIPLAIMLARYFIGCESIGELFFATFFGILIGIVLFSANKAFFGLEGINFLGLPYVVDKSQKGSDIYVCAPTSVQFMDKK
jgi:hypothetical protein